MTGTRGSPASASGRSGRSLPSWLAPLSLALAFALLTLWSWGKWTDVQIDFGRELYIPWQLSRGRVLYRDIAYRHGLLPPYVNGLWFLLFGASLRTLVFANLAVLAAITAMTYRIFLRACDRITATAACLVLLGVFGFSQYVGVANYNYVTPYQHQQTHGLALSLAMIVALSRLSRTRSPLAAAVAGGCLGLVFLTKLELAVPAASACALAWSLIVAGRDPGARALARPLLVFLLAALLPLAASFLLLDAHMPAALAVRGVLGNWTSSVGGTLEEPFYRTVLGVDNVSGNLARMLRSFLGIAGFVGVTVVLDRLLRAARHPAVPWLSGAAAFALLVALADRIPWMELSSALPVTTLLAAVALLGACLHHASRREELAPRLPLALWAGYALALLGKIVLNARFAHYGFVLAMPATLLLVVCLVHVLPGWLRAHFGGGVVFRAVALAAVAAGTLYLLGWSQALYAQKDHRIGEGSDSMLVAAPRYDRRGEVFSAAFRKLASIMPPEATLAVLPEGSILNFWLRRDSSSRYVLFIPPEVRALGGEGVVLGDLRRHPPDFIALTARAHVEFGVGPFGVDPRNGRRIAEWIARNYRRVALVGADPLQGGGFGIAILRRRAGPPAGGEMPAEPGPFVSNPDGRALRPLDQRLRALGSLE